MSKIPTQISEVWYFNTSSLYFIFHNSYHFIPPRSCLQPGEYNSQPRILFLKIHFSFILSLVYIFKVVWSIQTYYQNSVSNSPASLDVSKLILSDPTQLYHLNDVIWRVYTPGSSLRTLLHNLVLYSITFYTHTKQ